MHTAFGQDGHLIANTDVTGNSNRSPNQTAATDRGAAGDPRASGNGRLRTDAHVVANLHEIIYFHTVLNHRLLERAAIDRCVRTYLDVITDMHAAQLRNLHPLRPIACKPETVGPDHDTAVQNASAADRDVMIQMHIRMQVRVRSDPAAAPNYATGLQNRMLTNPDIVTN